MSTDKPILLTALEYELLCEIREKRNIVHTITRQRALDAMQYTGLWYWRRNGFRDERRTLTSKGLKALADTESAPMLELVMFGADGFFIVRRPGPAAGVRWTPSGLAAYALEVASAAGATLIASRVVNSDRDPHVDIVASMRWALDAMTPPAPCGDSR